MNATNSTASGNRHDDVSQEDKQVSCVEQIEFNFAAEVTTIPAKKCRSRKALIRDKSGTKESNVKADAFGAGWIKNVCLNISQARDLREAVALSAYYLSELIDLEVEKRGIVKNGNKPTQHTARHHYTASCLKRVKIQVMEHWLGY